MPVLEQIVAQVLAVPVHDVTDDTGPSTTGSWSSLRHVQIIAMVEDHFGIKLEARQIRSIRKVGDLRATLREIGLPT